MRQLKILLLTSCFASFLFANAFCVEWTPTFSQAELQAKETHKPIVLVFTGSDWCKWCQKLDSEILKTSEFSRLTKDNFIFVEVDFPRGKKLPSGTSSSQNDALKRRFGVTGFPTVIVLDENANVIGRTGYREGGAAAYAQHLNGFLQKTR